jgi:hypothetical protein
MDQLNQLTSTNLVGLMISADGPRLIPARIDWPLHQALRELYAEAGRQGLRSQLPDMHPRPDPGVSLRMGGADQALRALAEKRVLIRQGEGRRAQYQVDAEAVVSLRRGLLRLPPALAHLVHRAGTRWEALVATSAKNRSTAAVSSAATVASEMPNRLQDAAGRVRSRATSRRPPDRRTLLVTL